jgi:hypothetical protein
MTLNHSDMGAIMCKLSLSRNKRSHFSQFEVMERVRCSTFKRRKHVLCHVESPYLVTSSQGILNLLSLIFFWRHEAIMNLHASKQ